MTPRQPSVPNVILKDIVILLFKNDNGGIISVNRGRAMGDGGQRTEDGEEGRRGKKDEWAFFPRNDGGTNAPPPNPSITEVHIWRGEQVTTGRERNYCRTARKPRCPCASF
jgi:hypothetical protein